MSVKILMIGRRRPGQSLSEHRRHMKDRHGVEVVNFIRSEPTSAPIRYVQNHVFDSSFGSGPIATDPLAHGLDFVTEIGFDTAETAQASRQTAFYRQRLQPDEAVMVDQANVLGPLARELDQHTSAIAPACPIKVFALLRAADGERPALEAAWPALSRALPLQGRQVRNAILTPAPLDGVDEFWLPDAEAAQAFVEIYRRQVLAPLHERGLLHRNGCPLLIAREYVLYAGAPQPGKSQ